MHKQLSEFLGDRHVSFHVLDTHRHHPSLDGPPLEEFDEGPKVDAGWRELPNPTLDTEPAGDGVMRVSFRVAGSGALAARFARATGERFWGFGVRSDCVERIEGVVENWVGEGPYQLDEYPLVRAITPRWAIRQRKDAAYYPVPWAFSSSGYGVLIDSPEFSRFRFLDDSWTVEVLSDRLAGRLFVGATPAELLRRFTEATGRQPYPAAQWFLGPWCQTGQADMVPYDLESKIITTLRDADAPVSAIETHMRRLPAGAHEGRRDAEQKRTRLFHEHGLASLTYLNPFVSQDYAQRFANAAPLLQRRPAGTPYLYPAYIGGRERPLTVEGQLDFTSQAAEEFFAELVLEAIEDGHDGWMEDFGEYTPPDSLCADGSTGTSAHNTYPVRYHAAAQRAAEVAGGDRPIARFGRSGWTAAAQHLPLVWGGDPTTGWDFDGLASAVTQGLSAGLSGIGFWGSDIGGFFTLGSQELDSELLIRWIQFGALSPLMRTKAEGVAIPARTRPQIWEPEILPQWRRWAKLHTQLSPYLLGAAAEYVETGLPLMRHMILVDPDDTSAQRSDQYMLGDWLLAAPVVRPGQREREVLLPKGRWIDLWRSASYEAKTGALKLGWLTVFEGGRHAKLPAPLGEAPLLVRAGAVIPLLPPDVWSLAGSRDESSLRLLAFPEGQTAARFERNGALLSAAGAGEWRLDIEAPRLIKFELEASLAFKPSEVSISDGRLDAWSYDATTRVLYARFSGKSSVLVVNA